MRLERIVELTASIAEAALSRAHLPAPANAGCSRTSTGRPRGDHRKLFYHRKLGGHPAFMDIVPRTSQSFGNIFLRLT